jgi:hypothetical protein
MILEWNSEDKSRKGKTMKQWMDGWMDGFG